MSLAIILSDILTFLVSFLGSEMTGWWPFQGHESGSFR